MEAFSRARAEIGPLGIDEEAFVLGVVGRAVARVASAGLPADGDAVARTIERTHTNDLYLVLAADGGDEVAWRRLVAQATPLLTGTLVRHGSAPAEAEAIVADVLGDLAGPPPAGCTRTLLGTYAGTAAVGGWLCVIALRRAGARFRGRKAPTAFDETRDGGRVASRSNRSTDADPAGRTMDREEGVRFGEAFDEVWSRIEPTGRLAVAAKHGDGRSQVEIARALRVSEATVSRIVGRAIATLREGLAAFDTDRDDVALVRVLESRLARSAVESPLYGGGHPIARVARADSPPRTPPESDR